MSRLFQPRIFAKLLIAFMVSGLPAPLRAETTARPNVLFIGLDDMNDWIGCLGGHPQARTPNLDRLAASGVLFANAYCPGAACNPSRSAFFTGKPCHQSGLYSNRQRMREVMPDAEIIPRYFSRHGYWSAGSGKMLHYFIDAGSWDEYFPDKETENPFPQSYRVAPRPVSLPRAGDWQYIETDWGPIKVDDEEFGGDYLVTKWVGDQLAKPHDKPFFLACGIYRPHEPWFVPEKYFDLFPLDKVQMPPGLKENDLDDVPAAGQSIGRNRYLEHIKAHGQWRQGVQAYLACVAYADAMVGRVLDALDRSPYRANTIVCLWGDNGFHLGEKEHWQKFTGWRQCDRIPLMIRVPEGAPGLPAGTPVGARCTRPVNLVDLYRTLTDLCGLPEKPDIGGHSLVPLLANPQAAWPYPSVTHLDHPDSFAVSTENWRYIHYADGGEELYHLATDPHEWTNLANEAIEKLAEMRSLAPADRHPLVSSTVPNPALEWIPADRGDCPASKDTTNAVAMHFLNLSGMKVRLWSVDQKGQKQAMDELVPNGVKAVQTVTGHAWLVTDLQGKPLGHFVAGPQSARAEIEQPEPEDPKSTRSNMLGKPESPVVGQAKPAPAGEPAGEITREQRVRWWREARFGMFIHWGLYAIPGGTWKGKVRDSGYSEWIMFDEKIPAKEYQQLAARFNPVKFDAAQWTAIARKAGMKYMVLTAKHHDGFSMFDSEHTPYNIADATPFKRDITKELSGACRDAGIRFGCYYSVDRDWYRPQGPGNRYRQANTWDFPDSKQEDFDRYLAGFAKPQIEEILTKYRPDVLWFDDIDMKNDAQVLDLYQTVRRLHPECVINSRIQGCVPPKKIPPPFCDYLSSGDNEILKGNIGFEWENPGSMNTSYGYNPNDHKWHSAAEIVSKLVQIVSKGGNYLLNVGPAPEGTIPQPCIDRLAEVGRWMDHNGEAIYGSSPWQVTDEVHEDSGRVIRFTSKGDAVHVFCPVNGKAGEITIKALGARQLRGRRIASITLLGSGDEVKWAQDDGKLTLALPADAPGGIIATYRIELRG